jgi:transcriptional regulator with XRE-family HTH domain
VDKGRLESFSISNFQMKHNKPGNYLKAFRRKSGLSQQDLGRLLGYRDAGQVSRHERATSMPPLAAAIAYELIFGVPVTSMFAGMRGEIARDVEAKLEGMKTTLESVSVSPPNASLVAQKLAWLSGRQRGQSSTGSS